MKVTSDTHPTVVSLDKRQLDDEHKVNGEAKSLDSLHYSADKLATVSGRDVVEKIVLTQPTASSNHSQFGISTAGPGHAQALLLLQEALAHEEKNEILQNDLQKPFLAFLALPENDSISDCFERSANSFLREHKEFKWTILIDVYRDKYINLGLQYLGETNTEKR